jgi:2'-5' RNA ligase
VEREAVSRLAPIVPGPAPEAFQPHLTLGRIRHAPGLRTAALIEGLTGTVFGGVHVSAVTLFESRLTPAGPTYVALGRTPLASSIP